MLPKACKLGATTLHSISDIAKHQRLKDNNEESVGAEDMIRELHFDSRERTDFLRAMHEVSEKHEDVATASLIENWIDETERHTWRNSW
jgi:starvation-inducible DNA-binding protein